jgi:hypothetical protein
MQTTTRVPRCSTARVTLVAADYAARCVYAQALRAPWRECTPCKGHGRARALRDGLDHVGEARGAARSRVALPHECGRRQRARAGRRAHLCADARPHDDGVLGAGECSLPGHYGCTQALCTWHERARQARWEQGQGGRRQARAARIAATGGPDARRVLAVPLAGGAAGQRRCWPTAQCSVGRLGRVPQP